MPAFSPLAILGANTTVRVHSLTSTTDEEGRVTSVTDEGAVYPAFIAQTTATATQEAGVSIEDVELVVRLPLGAAVDDSSVIAVTNFHPRMDGMWNVARVRILPSALRVFLQRR